MSEPWTTSDMSHTWVKYVNPVLNLDLANDMRSFKLDSTLPHRMEKYSAIYNKSGRIGIYTKEVPPDIF